MKTVFSIFAFLMLVPVSAFSSPLKDSQDGVFTYSFDGKDKKAIQVKATDTYSDEKGYGYDYQYVIDAARKQQTESFRLSDGIFYFSVAVPDGNYKVTVTLGSKKKAGNTTVRAESRRLYVQNEETKKGEFKTFSFVVNKHNTTINLPDGKTDVVKITPREKGVIRWDDKLTLEINGDAPACSSIKIEPVDVPTMYLCGNSTVVDQDFEPWASWGQMFTYWFNDKVAVSNYAASGLTSTSFNAQNRLKKIVSLLKEGDYVFIEFGHNDEKDKMPGSGAFYNYTYNLKSYVDQIRAKGATPVICTPTERRMVKNDGSFSPTHGKYPEAAIAVAKDLNVGLIDLTSMSQTLYKTMGAEDSKRLLVHYPAGTYPNQGKAFEDNTHFNPFGAYEMSRLIIRGMKQLNLPVLQYLKDGYKDLDPSQPDDWKAFKWNDSPFLDVVKPDGN